MAVPQKKKSRSKRDMGRAHHALKTTALIDCPNCGETMRLHRVCPSCGFYKGKEVLPLEEEE